MDNPTKNAMRAYQQALHELMEGASEIWTATDERCFERTMQGLPKDAVGEANDILFEAYKLLHRARGVMNKAVGE